MANNLKKVVVKKKPTTPADERETMSETEPLARSDKQSDDSDGLFDNIHQRLKKKDSEPKQPVENNDEEGLFDSMKNPFSKLKGSSSKKKKKEPSAKKKKKKKEKKKLSSKERQAKIEKRYLRDGENYYPYAGLSHSLWKTSRFLMYSILAIVVAWLVSFVLSMVATFFGYNESMISMHESIGASFYDSGLMGNPESILNFFQNIADVLERLSEFGFWLPFLRLVFTVLIVVFVTYGISILLRRHNHELRPLADDRLARRIKKYAVDRLNVNREILPETDIHGKEIHKYKNQDEYNAIRAIRNMEVSVHTRRDVKGDKYHTEAYVRIRQPYHQGSREFLARMIKDMTNIITAGSGGTLTFGPGQQGADQRFLTYSVEKDVTEEYRQKALASVEKRKRRIQITQGIDPDDVEVATSGATYTFDIDIFGDNTEKIKQATIGAMEYAEKQRKSLDIYFASQASADSGGGRSSGVSLVKMDAGNTSAQYRYAISGYDINPSKITEDLQISTRTRGIAAHLDGGELVVTLPYPSNISVPQDTRTMIMEVFG